jgi:hypothetical protein
MKYVLRWTRLVLAVAALGLVLPRRSMAYLDPGTGSYMLQMLLALLVGGAFALKVFWKRILAFFRRERPAESTPDAQQEQTKDEDQHNT